MVTAGVSHRPTCPGCSKMSSLSEVTTIQLEFNELTRLTKDPKYKVKLFIFPCCFNHVNSLQILLCQR